MSLHQTKLCLFCGNTFVDMGRRKPFSYCSRDCSRKLWETKNPEKAKEVKRAYAQNNPTKRAASTERYRKANTAYYAEYASLRSRNMKHAKPKWLDEFEMLWIAEIYDAASKRGLEVDHIVPIKGKTVCGLHVPWNMQLLTRSENSKKSNKFDDDIICIIKG